MAADGLIRLMWQRRGALDGIVSQIYRNAGGLSPDPESFVARAAQLVDHLSRLVKLQPACVKQAVCVEW